MSTKDYSAKLLEMEGVRIENLEETEQEIVLQISLEQRAQICGRCGAETERVHDYRIRQVRDLELRGKPLRLLYRRRRYVCPVCGKRFAEKNTFVGRYMRFTHRTGEKIMALLRRRSSMKDIARDAGVSISGVQRVLRMAPVSKPQRLPEAVSFDEFKGNAGGERFQCIVTDPLSRRVFDILPSRTVETIQDYLRTFPNRGEVSRLRIQRTGYRSHHFQDHVRGRHFAEGLAGGADAQEPESKPGRSTYAGKNHSRASGGIGAGGGRGQPVAEIAEATAQGAEITTELNGQVLTITAQEPENMETAFNVTSERRKVLVEAVKAFVDAPAVYQNAPSFAYVIGDYTVSKIGTVSGSANEALMAALNAKGFIIE